MGPAAIYGALRDNFPIITIGRGSLFGEPPLQHIETEHFGSVLKGTDRGDTEIGILVVALPEANLFDLGGLPEELLGAHLDSDAATTICAVTWESQ